MSKSTVPGFTPSFMVTPQQAEFIQAIRRQGVISRTDISQIIGLWRKS